MLGNHPTRRSGSGSAASDRPFRDGREQRARARQAAEALFAQKPPPVVASPPSTDPPARQPRVLKPAPAPAAGPPIETAATPEPPAPAAAPHVARIRAWLKYGMTIAQVAEAYLVPITEIKRILGKP